MKKQTPFIVLSSEKTDVPLYRQIYETIRQAILNGELGANSQIPASRALAGELGVSRITVVNAYEQLFAEGYLEGKIGAGTFVASKLPDDLLQISNSKGLNKKINISAENIKLSAFAERLRKNKTASSRPQNHLNAVPFRNGLTAVDEFPFDIWEKIAVRVFRQSHNKIYGYGEAAGYLPLRESVAAHFAASRGVHCDIEQIFITNGAQHALDLIARVLLKEDDKVWIEDPCYREAYNVFYSNGAQMIPVSVDEEGFNLAEAEKKETAKLVYITPSHQYPTGVTMSLTRRLNLLEWARKNNSWIIEDDYNSEFRYAGRPLASLQNLDNFGRVIYVGTFSKTIFPALRLGCLIVPKNLVEIFSAARQLCDWHSPIFEQAILADFIAEGHFGRHLRRMRTLYEKRQRFLVAEAEKELGEFLKVKPSSSGMHIIGWLADGLNDQKISEKAAEHSLSLSPLSSYCLKNKLPSGIILGYTGFNAEQIRKGVRKIKEILSD